MAAACPSTFTSATGRSAILAFAQSPLGNVANVESPLAGSRNGFHFSLGSLPIACQCPRSHGRVHSATMARAGGRIQCFKFSHMVRPFVAFSMAEHLAEEVTGAPGLGPGEERLGIGVFHDGAIGHEDHSVGRLAGKPHLVGDDQHRHALFRE